MGVDSIARGLGARARLIADERAPRLSIVSGAMQNFGFGSRTVATAGNWDNYRVRHTNRTGKAVAGLRLVFGNYGPSSAKERVNSNSIKIKTAIELEGTVADQTKPRTGIPFNGAQTLTLEKIGSVSPTYITQPIGGVLAADAVFYERTAATTLNNSEIYQMGGSLRGGTSTFGLSTGEASHNNSAAERIWDGSDITSTPVDTCYSAVCVLGYCVDGSVAKSVAILGDSIVAGSDDAAFGQVGGWALRAFADYPHVFLPFAGEKMQEQIIRSNNYCRFDISGYATHVLYAYGRNDLGAARTAVQMKADYLTAAYQYMARGQGFILPTILPAPSSTDGFFTVANQTKESTEAVRVAVNQWIRDTSADGFVAQANAQVAGIAGAGAAATCDPCAQLECNSAGVLAQDGGYVLGAASAVLTSGTATAATTTTLSDSGKSWTVNAYKGGTVYITGGTGAGQSRCIGYNTATQLGLASPWTVTPDATSTYQVFTSLVGMTGVHPHTPGHILAAAAVNAAALLG